MRTTVTLDQDVVELLNEAMHRSRTSFKQTLNAAIRAGLTRTNNERAKQPFKVRARPLTLRPGLDPARFNQLADELETAAWQEKAKTL